MWFLRRAGNRAYFWHIKLAGSCNHLKTSYPRPIDLQFLGIVLILKLQEKMSSLKEIREEILISKEIFLSLSTDIHNLSVLLVCIYLASCLLWPCLSSY